MHDPQNATDQTTETSETTEASELAGANKATTFAEPRKTTETEKHSQTRYVRIRMPDHLYRRLKHKLADADPGTSLSDLVVQTLDEHLSALG